MICPQVIIYGFMYANVNMHYHMHTFYCTAMGMGRVTIDKDVCMYCQLRPLIDQIGLRRWHQFKVCSKMQEQTWLLNSLLVLLRHLIYCSTQPSSRCINLIFEQGLRNLYGIKRFWFATGILDMLIILLSLL